VVKIWNVEFEMSFLNQLSRVTVLLVLALGCSSKSKQPQSPAKAVKKVPVADAAPVVVSPAKPDESAKGDPSKSPVPVAPPTDFRTPFRAVLSSGFRKKAPKANLAYCKSSYETFLAKPGKARPFLEKKLRSGRMSEKPLALHLLGRLGPAAKNSERYVGDVALYAWDIAVNRCLARLKGEKVKGRFIEATDEQTAKCKNKVIGGRAPSSLRMACDALHRIGGKRSVKRLVKSGIGGYFAHPCVRYFLETDLEAPGTLTFIAREIDMKPNGALVREILIEQRAKGISALSKILEARARSGKIGGATCALEEVAAAYYRQGGGLAKLDAETSALLRSMSAGKFKDGKAVAAPAIRCAKRSIEVLSQPPVSTPERRQRVRPKASTLPFCPEK